jgi:DNA-binding response OmpR family regulator
MVHGVGLAKSAESRTVTLHAPRGVRRRAVQAVERLVARVLVVEDDESIGRTLCAILAAEGYRVEQAATVAGAVARIERTRFDVLLLDLRFGGEDGLAVLRRLKEVRPSAAGIVLTAHGSLEDAVAAMRAGADDFLLKPRTCRSARPRSPGRCTGAPP